jgi:hypothetical protein
MPTVDRSDNFQLMEAFVKSTALAASMLGAALSQNAPPGNPANTGFMAQQPNDRLASRLVGLNIQNTGDENIGEIHDIVLTDGSRKGVCRQCGWISRHGHALCGDRFQSGDTDAPGRKDLESHHECKQGSAQGRSGIQVRVGVAKKMSPANLRSA